MRTHINDIKAGQRCLIQGTIVKSDVFKPIADTETRDFLFNNGRYLRNITPAPRKRLVLKNASFIYTDEETKEGVDVYTEYLYERMSISKVSSYSNLLVVNDRTNVVPILAIQESNPENFRTIDFEGELAADQDVLLSLRAYNDGQNATHIFEAILVCDTRVKYVAAPDSLRYFLRSKGVLLDN